MEEFRKEYEGEGGEEGREEAPGQAPGGGEYYEYQGGAPETEEEYPEYEEYEPGDEYEDAGDGAYEEETLSAGERIALSAAEIARAKREKEAKGREEEAKRLGLQAKIMKLDVGERAKLARNGDKDCRSILIRDGNKGVSLAVMSNPKITISEVELISASRNVCEEVLREIAGNRDWCKSYAVTLNLAFNPKTPVGVALTFLPKLKTRDLRFLAKSKGVPEAVRVTAKRLAEKRKF